MTYEKKIKTIGIISIVYGVLEFLLISSWSVMLLSLGYFLATGPTMDDFIGGTVFPLLVFVISLSFIIGGINLLRRKNWGRILLMISLSTTILYLLISWIITIISPKRSIGLEDIILWGILLLHYWVLKILFDKKIKEILKK